MAKPLHISLVAIPEASTSTLLGLYDVLNGFELLRGFDETLPEAAPFVVEIVSTEGQPMKLASGLLTPVHKSVTEVPRTDVVIVPSVVLRSDGWSCGRYPELVCWVRKAHAAGALVCSACSGVFLLAETELLSERSITLHWSYAEKFRAIFPNVVLHPERPLVVSGDHSELITSGAAMSWHDLVLYLISRLVGRTAAQSMANFFALQWHQDGLGPYIVFEGQKDHGDGAISAAQRWLADHYAVADPVAEVVSLSDLAERTFMRRFQQATGHSPLTYVQHLRVEDAKRRLERTIEPIERISWHVGYEEPAFFRRLFKRIAGVTPGQYRRRFRVPDPG